MFCSPVAESAQACARHPHAAHPPTRTRACAAALMGDQNIESLFPNSCWLHGDADPNKGFTTARQVRMLIRGILGETNPSKLDKLEQNNFGSWSMSNLITAYREIAERTKSSDLFHVAESLRPQVVRGDTSSSAAEGNKHPSGGDNEDDEVSPRMT